MADDMSVNICGNRRLSAENVAGISFRISVIRTAVIGIKAVTEIIISRVNLALKTLRVAAVDSDCMSQQINCGAVAVIADMNLRRVCLTVAARENQQCRQREHQGKVFNHLKHLRKIFLVKL